MFYPPSAARPTIEHLDHGPVTSAGLQPLEHRVVRTSSAKCASPFPSLTDLRPMGPRTAAGATRGLCLLGPCPGAAPVAMLGQELDWRGACGRLAPETVRPVSVCAGDENQAQAGVRTHLRTGVQLGNGGVHPHHHARDRSPWEPWHFHARTPANGPSTFCPKSKTIERTP